MTTHTLEIKTATIEIHVIRVDGHKMTKATFRQIPHESESIIDKSTILGWVSDDFTYLVWNMNGSIKKRMRHCKTWPKFIDLPMGKYSNGSEFTMEEIKQEFPQLFIAT